MEDNINTQRLPVQEALKVAHGWAKRSDEIVFQNSINEWAPRSSAKEALKAAHGWTKRSDDIVFQNSINEWVPRLSAKAGYGWVRGD